jgi:hypothetical protein
MKNCTVDQRDSDLKQQQQQQQIDKNIYDIVKITKEK